MHKAYEEAPGSDDVRRNLLFGYIKYANFLESEGRLDEAISYLAMAHEMDADNDAAANDLAKLYCDKAISLSSEGNHGMAMENLNNASGIALGSSKKVRKNISNYLFNIFIT